MCVFDVWSVALYGGSDEAHVTDEYAIQNPICDTYLTINTLL